MSAHLFASTTPGRVRLRSNRLKDPQFTQKLQGCLEEITAINSIRCNPAGSSLVVEYDLEEISEEDIESEVENHYFSVMNALRDRRGEAFGKLTKAGMAASLAATLAYAFTGKKRQHINSGVAFLGFAALHIARHSTRLLK